MWLGGQLSSTPKTWVCPFRVTPVVWAELVQIHTFQAYLFFPLVSFKVDSQDWIRSGASLSLRLSHMDTERQKYRRRGGWGWSPCSARMTQSVCCLSAHSRSLKDSVTSTSSDSQPDYASPTPTLSPLVTSLIVSFTSSCLSMCWSTCLSVCLVNLSTPLSLLFQLVIHHSLLFYSACCYVWELKCYMGIFWYHILSRLNITWWLIEHLSVLCFNVSTVFFSETQYERSCLSLVTKRTTYPHIETT